MEVDGLSGNRATERRRGVDSGGASVAGLDVGGCPFAGAVASAECWGDGMDGIAGVTSLSAGGCSTEREGAAAEYWGDGMGQRGMRGPGE